MKRREQALLRHWMGAEAAGDEPAAERALVALIRRLPELRPGPGFAGRVLTTAGQVVSAPVARLSWPLRAAISVCLVLSGLTAIPLQWEMDVLAAVLLVSPEASPETYTGLQYWIATVREGLEESYAQYPFLAYGTDWLAFAHVIIGILFLGPLLDPVRNRWVIVFGMIACVLVVPTALIFDPLRGIPFYWQLIDCSFGVFGFIPLWLSWRFTRKLAAIDGVD